MVADLCAGIREEVALWKRFPEAQDGSMDSRIVGNAADAATGFQIGREDDCLISGFGAVGSGTHAATAWPPGER